MLVADRSHRWISSAVCRLVRRVPVPSLDQLGSCPAHLAQTSDCSEVLSFDMGGTTAKICLIDDATPLLSRAFEVDRVYRFKKGSGLPVRIPGIEMVEIENDLPRVTWKEYSKTLGSEPD